MAANLKEKYLITALLGPLSDEKSAATVSRRDFNERARRRESWGRDGRMTDSFFICGARWWLVGDHEACGSTSNPHMAAVIPAINVRLTAARLLHWMYTITQRGEKKKDP